MTTCSRPYGTERVVKRQLKRGSVVLTRVRPRILADRKSILRVPLLRPWPTLNPSVTLMAFSDPVGDFFRTDDH